MGTRKRKLYSNLVFDIGFRKKNQFLNKKKIKKKRET